MNTNMTLRTVEPLFLYTVMNPITEVDEQTCSEKSFARYDHVYLFTHH